MKNINFWQPRSCHKWPFDSFFQKFKTFNIVKLVNTHIEVQIQEDNA